MEELTEQQIRERNSRFIIKVSDKNERQVQEKWITTKDIDTELNKLRQSEPEYKYEVVYEYKEGGL
tara:strand:- start:361 stop:558 length:198 start_codon:yes stop_codon:yes gene_type:complete